MSENRLLTNNDEFDIYFDQIRFTLDCCSLIKVSAKLIPPLPEDLEELVVFPDCRSETRSLKLKANKTHINKKRKLLNYDSCLMFHVSGISRDNGRLSVIGMGRMDLFEKPENSTSTQKCILRTGGHQLRVFQVPPHDDKNELDETDFPLKDAVPCFALMLRIEEHSEKVVPMPSYSSGYYSRGNFILTKQEKNIVEYYRKYNGPVTSRLKDACLEIQEMDTQRLSSEQNQHSDKPSQTTPDISEKSTKEEIQKWAENRLDSNHPMNVDTDMNCLRLSKMVGFDSDFGLAFNFHKIFNVPAKQHFLNIAAILLTSDSPFPNSILMNTSHSFDIPISYQEWVPESENTVKMTLGKHPKLVFCVLGLDVDYTPSSDLEQLGKVETKKGSTDNGFSVVCWGVIDVLTPSGCVNNGRHLLPMFSGPPPIKIKSLRTMPSADWLHVSIPKEKISFTSTNTILKVDICNGFEVDFGKLQIEKELVEVASKAQQEKFQETLRGKLKPTGPTLSENVIAKLPKKEAKLGTKSNMYEKLKNNYEKTMNARLVEEAKQLAKCDNIYYL